MAGRSVWNATSYGYSPIYWLTIAGIPIVWTERGTDKTLPTGFADSEVAALVIDDSGPIGIEQVDRDRGIGTGLPLSFKLLDSDTLSTWIAKWSLYANLTVQLDWNDTTATVDDTTGWPATGYFYAGGERIAYSGKTGTTFTGLSRAQSGTLAQTHRVGTTAANLTDLPRFWSGREVCLYAAWCDPSGHVCGTALADQSVMLWRGRLDGRASREMDGFAFEAISLDRIVDQPLPEAVTGKIVSSLDYWAVETGWQATLYMEGHNPGGNPIWSYSATITPFATYTEGELITAEASRAAISAAFEAWVVAQSLTGTFDGLAWRKLSTFQYTADVQLDDPHGLELVYGVFTFGDAFFDYGALSALGGADHNLMPTGLLLNQYGTGASLFGAGQAPSVAIELTEGDPAELAGAAGAITITDTDGNKFNFGYLDADKVGQYLVLSGLYGQSGQQELVDGAKFIGADVSLSPTILQPWHETLLRMLESSGTGDRGAYDAGARQSGYGLPAAVIDWEAMAATMHSASNTFDSQLDVAGKAVPDAIGGWLSLFRLALVAQPTDADGTPVKLQVVNLGPGSDYQTTITDADLLAHSGDPVTAVERAPAPNCIKITNGDNSLTYNDSNSQEAIGLTEVSWEIQTAQQTALAEAAQSAVASLFAFDQTAQAVQIRVHPGVDADVGDAVWLELTHPALWSYTTNKAGYTGPGRVVGRTLDPSTLAVSLKLLIDGAVQVLSLSPSAVVLARQASANPIWIEIPAIYADHVNKSLADSATIRLTHYQPGQVETAAEYHTITAAAIVGSNLRLTTGTQTGHTVTVGASYLTLPVTALSTTYQTRFAHAADGSNWA
jgi:hypothetical protein